jgi:hypothetical protein
MSLQLEQVLSQVRQLSPQDQRQLVAQLVGEGNQAHGINEAPDDSPEERLPQGPEAELEYVDGILVVKSQGQKLSGDLVGSMREERIRQIGGW